MTQTNQTESLLPNDHQIWQASLQWHPAPEQQQQFQSLYAGILQGNQQMNLTRITEPTEFWEKHLWDSLSGVAPWLQPPVSRPEWATKRSTATVTVIDIGTGAGFPGLPAAIALPHWQVTLLDSTQKKIRFLQELIQEQRLSTVRAIADRAEFLAHQLSHREQYDLALVRAVGPAAACAEYALPLLKVGGIAVLYRGQWTEAESQALAQVAPKLGGSLLDEQAWQTPLTHGTRHCIYLHKRTTTREAFPRSAGIPTKQPLV
ncbi:MAG: 16S rRNA (guanine(527)-N(7))-methyltransferase RsmG [Cyanobacteria bacterium P01_F01_bin.86]